MIDGDEGVGGVRLEKFEEEETALKAAQEKLEEEDRKGAIIRKASDNAQRKYRDKRLFKRLNLLGLY